MIDRPAVCVLVVLLLTAALTSCRQEAWYDILPVNSPTKVPLRFTTLAHVATIGSNGGVPEAVFGRISGLAIGPDAIYLLDAQGPRIRSFSLDGAPLNAIGGVGEGPGEYITPLALGLDDSDRLFVRDAASIVIYEADGRFVSEYRIPPLAPFSGTLPFTVAGAGGVYIAEALVMDGRYPKDWTWGTVRYDGSVDPVETRRIPPIGSREPLLTYEFGDGRRLFRRPPFAPKFVWAVSRTGELAFGFGDTYAIALESRDGSRRMLGRHLSAPAITATECSDEEAALTTVIRGARNIRGWRPDTCPQRHPSLSAVTFDWDGNLWVARVRESVRAPECEGAKPYGRRTCWEALFALDMFDRDGDLAGEIALPSGFHLDPPPVVRGDLLVARVTDQAGLEAVAVYKLKSPR